MTDPRLNVVTTEWRRDAVKEAANRQNMSMKEWVNRVIDQNLDYDTVDNLSVLRDRREDLLNEIENLESDIEQKRSDLEKKREELETIESQIEDERDRKDTYRNALEDLADLAEEKPNMHFDTGNGKVQRLSTNFEIPPRKILEDLHNIGVDANRLEGIVVDNGGGSV